MDAVVPQIGTESEHLLLDVWTHQNAGRHTTGISGLNLYTAVVRRIHSTYDILSTKNVLRDPFSGETRMMQSGLMYITAACRYGEVVPGSTNAAGASPTQNSGSSHVRSRSRDVNDGRYSRLGGMRLNTGTSGMSML